MRHRRDPGAFRGLVFRVDTSSQFPHSSGVEQRANAVNSERTPSVPAAAAALGFFVMIGLVVGGWVLGAEIKAVRLADRYVTVKGLVERTVKSDTAIWPITFKEAGNDLPAVFAKSEEDKAAVLKFLSDQSVTSQEITLGQVQVTDKEANEYGPNSAGPRYIVQQTITVQTSDVDKIARVGQKTAQLVQAGVVIGGGFGQGGISYKFTGLNALKPDMITEATRNARAAADRFAADSGSQVGSIRSANQGVFSISGVNDSNDVSSDDGSPGGSGAHADASLMKKIRVVTTVDYYLK